LGTTLKTPFSPLSFGKSFMKIRSGVPENGCLIVVADGKKAKTKKAKKTYVKHIRIRLIGGCVNKIHGLFDGSVNGAKEQDNMRQRSGSSVAIVQRSQASSWMSWKTCSRRLIILMCSAARNWRLELILLRPESRSVQQQIVAVHTC